ncbi:hypothetical protein [Caulobacter phage Cr30]|uniref:hypothetical protein n=1 Tax=Caulobacter phage Cr30 TaxID=1357714 RepID=UPI0004A9B836|nr:hypothetical protein OZ74_gp107 [Caulobacter phage Cr30]AGS80992.1 hypothetical protein [Caulobacter phage Cr30]
MQYTPTTAYSPSWKQQDRRKVTPFRKFLGIWSVEKDLIRSKYFEWSSGWGLTFDFSKFRYADEHDGAMLHFQAIYGHWFIYLPFLKFKPRDYYDHVESPTYGFSWRWDNDLGGIHWHWNRKTKITPMPWADHTTKYEYLGEDGNWYSILPFDSNQIPRYTEVHDYAYYSHGLKELQTAKATVTRTRHEIKWTWFGTHKSPVSDFLRKIQFFGVRRQDNIDVEFDQEMGSRKGSWKGGTIGCGYIMKQDESPLHCLRRMERERHFDR